MFIEVNISNELMIYFNLTNESYFNLDAHVLISIFNKIIRDLFKLENHEHSEFRNRTNIKQTKNITLKLPEQ